MDFLTWVDWISTASQHGMPGTPNMKTTYSGLLFAIYSLLLADFASANAEFYPLEGKVIFDENGSVTPMYSYQKYFFLTSDTYNSPISTYNSVTNSLSCMLTRGGCERGSSTLQYESKGISNTKNEVYINPPLLQCYDDGASDKNQSASIGYLDKHSQGGEFFQNTILFGSSLLRAGDYNAILICARTSDGKFHTPVSDPSLTDTFELKNIIINYHTSLNIP